MCGEARHDSPAIIDLVAEVIEHGLHTFCFGLVQRHRFHFGHGVALDHLIQILDGRRPILYPRMNLTVRVLTFDEVTIRHVHFKINTCRARISDQIVTQRTGQGRVIQDHALQRIHNSRAAVYDVKAGQLQLIDETPDTDFWAARTQ